MAVLARPINTQELNYWGTASIMSSLLIKNISQKKILLALDAALNISLITPSYGLKTMYISIDPLFDQSTINPAQLIQVGTNG